MKICFLSDINSVHTQKWIDYFSSKGHEIHVISLRDGEYGTAVVHSMNVDSAVAKSSTVSKLQYVKKFIQVKKIIKKINPDIINAHYASSYGLLGALSKAHPFVLSVWGSDIYDFPKKSILHKKLIQFNLKKADYIFSTGAQMKNEIQKYINREVFLTPFGIDTKVFLGEKMEHDGIIIGIAKSLESIYGIDLLIKSFARLSKKHENLYLEIAGEGTEKENLKNLCMELGINTKVSFLGFLGKESIVDFYNKLDIAVFPSRQESFGVAALEAQASRVPVVASDAPGFNDTVIDGKTGFIFKNSNLDELTDKIEKLIDDKNLRNSMGDNGRQFVKERYELEKNFRDIEKKFENISLKK
ncbi:MAG: glycosyltransferase [Clostridiales bacterium]|nr:glycosyltransferase [Clostridiales bacterium]